MSELSEEQLIQEEQYSFPYHYIPQGKPNFTISYYWAWGINYVAATEFLIEKLEKINFRKLIDVGTGDGRLVKDFSAKFPEQKIVGVDYSAHAIKLAQVLNPTCEFRSLDIFTEDLEEKFDCLSLIEVFEHIPLDMAAGFAKRIAHYVEDKGDVIITVPHKNKPLIDKHYQHFTKESLYAYYEEDFDLIEVEYIQKSSVAASMIKGLLSNGLFVLNAQGLKNTLYGWFSKYCFRANENNGTRLYMHLRKK
ncbi:hypothetical protein BFP72_00120 [Reichenbachiella sp. 5M10]|uniref:class I SAM-dependent methyltransferase n=1 Tax=Reichenbachiella sp. 5M10 TaxID=1889772 RepID=UPI000C1507A0|nr:class I SAM-dependent methyltransferase [Reichenbachiella sp. 5M10]PIB33949.1 hypothetical protein BFP72_00120 [Reichenbachiella sp. 5M10]